LVSPGVEAGAWFTAGHPATCVVTKLSVSEAQESVPRQLAQASAGCAGRQDPFANPTDGRLLEEPAFLFAAAGVFNICTRFRRRRRRPKITKNHWDTTDFFRETALVQPLPYLQPSNRTDAAGTGREAAPEQSDQAVPK